MKILIFGSDGLVGNSLRRVFEKNSKSKNYETLFSTRKDTDLFSYDETFEEDSLLFDWDGDALASAGFGTDEDYNGYNEEY